MIPPLFLFGTLRHLPLLEALIGDTSGLDIVPAEMPGFAVLGVAEGPFPMIVTQADAVTTGVLVSGLQPKDIEKLDFYEGAFGYVLKPVSLSDGTEAQAYFPPPSKWTPLGPWDFEAWERDWAQISVMAATEAIGYLGEKSPQDVAAMFEMIRARAASTLNAQTSCHGADTLQGRVDISARRRPYARYFAVDEFDLRHARFDGQMSPEVSRAVFRAPDATLVLPYDPHRDRVLLVEQIRMGPLARGDRSLWQLEAVAGRIDAGENPQTAARREAMEEAGVTLGALHPVGEVYCSPGNSSEFYYLFVGLADLPDASQGVGGLASEDEDIRSHLLSYDDLMQMCDDMAVANAPLLIFALWLARNRARLKEQAGA